MLPLIQAMHIPDGLLSAPSLVVTGVASAVSIAYSAKRAEAGPSSRIPLLGVLGAFVFAAQMVNFPVGPGASGHLLGSALLAATVGPWAATIVMTAILLVQALVFQDGGILALCANIFNMAVVGVWSAWLPFRALQKSRHARLGLFAGAFLSVTLSAGLALGQLVLSSDLFTPPLLIFCAGLFTLTGLIEAAITLAAWEAIERLEGRNVSPSRFNGTRASIVLASISLVLAGVFFASSAPDVLEFFSQQTGVAKNAVSSFPALFPDYEFKGANAEWMRKSLAGIAGLLIVYVLSMVLARFMPRAQQ